jgi:hypothetical protein
MGCRFCFRLVYGQQMRKGIVYEIDRFWNGVYDSDPWRFLREIKNWQRRRKCAGTCGLWNGHKRQRPLRSREMV